MKQFRLLLLGWILFFSTATITAQDIHFSLFNMSPLTMNPAQTGAFEGTARVGGIYRDQFASFLQNQFTTTIFYVDAPIIRGLGKYDWVGVGFTNIDDQAGDLGLQRTGQLFSASYHRSLSKRNADHVLTLGIQAGTIGRKLDFASIQLGNVISDFNRDVIQLEGTTRDRGLDNTASNVNPETSFFDISAGLMLRSVLNDRTRLEVGVAGIHLTGSDNPLLNETIRDTVDMNGNTVVADDEYKQPFLFNLHGRLRYQLTDKWTLTPGVLARTTEGTPPEIIVQTWAGRQINDDFDLNVGLAYRFADAAQVLLGLDYLKDLKIALSYDLNLSSLNTISDYQGGFELAASYIIKLYKQPDTNPTILCPKF